jgi:hypothetical protein
VLGRRSSSFRPADLTRAVLTPIGDRHGIDYDSAMFTAPSRPEDLGFEAIRCCTGLVVAFAYEDAWPTDDRATRRLGKKAAALVRDSFHDTPGRDAVAWAACGFGRVMADLRRRAAERGGDDANAYRATAEADERLARLAACIRPVDEQHPAIAYARKLHGSRGYDIDNADARIDLHACASRTAATVEALSLATWPSTPELEPAITRWTYNLHVEFAAAVQSDWSLAASYWGNLIGPDPIPYADMIDVVAAEHGR